MKPAPRGEVLVVGGPPEKLAALREALAGFGCVPLEANARANPAERDVAALAAAFALTPRQAEVLYWAAQGKINRDIAAIVGASPATVKKHLERVFARLGVETRTAAAAMALGRLRG